MSAKKADPRNVKTKRAKAPGMLILDASGKKVPQKVNVLGARLPVGRVLDVPPEVERTALDNRKGFRETLKSYAEAASQARKAGANVTVKLEVRPDGSVRPAGGFKALRRRRYSPAQSESFSTGPDPEPKSQSGLERARRKSDDKVADVLNGVDMLTSDQIGKRLGVSRETVNQKRHRGELLGVGGIKRGYRYPDWQIDTTGVRAVGGIDRVIAACRGDHWRAYRILRQPHAELDGMTGLDALKAGRADKLVGVIESMERGEFA